MRIIRRTLLVMLAAALLAALLVSRSTVSFAEEAASVPLPRTFQKARLGMGIAELVRVYPQLAKVTPAPRLEQSVVMHSSDPYVRHVEYRFHEGTLYQLHISYNLKRLPRGYNGLLSRLKQTYGKPSVEGLEDYDLDAGILSTTRSVWTDGITRITLTERRTIREAREGKEILLIMTDLQLERSHEEALAERQRQMELNVPIPRSEQNPGGGRTASPTPLPTQEAAQG